MTDAYFEKEVKAVRSTMNAIAYRVIRNKDESEEAVSDAILKAWSRRDELEPEKIRQYLLRTVMNTAIDITRTSRYKREIGRPAAMGFADWIDMLDSQGRARGEHKIRRNYMAEDIVTMLLVEDILRTLKPEVQVLFAQHFGEGKSMAKIAAEFGTRQSTIKPRVYRALLRIRNAHPELQ